MRIPLKLPVLLLKLHAHPVKTPRNLFQIPRNLFQTLRTLFQTLRTLVETPCASCKNLLRRMWAAARKSWKSLRAFPFSSRLAPHFSLLLLKLHVHLVEICFAECGRRLGRVENPFRLSPTPLDLHHIFPLLLFNFPLLLFNLSFLQLNL